MGAAPDGEPGSVADPDLGSGASRRGRARRRAAELSESLQREARVRYDRISAQWSPATQRRADSMSGAGLAAARAFTSSRLSGLAAEMAFWGIFALPWMVLGLAAGLATFQSWFGLDVVSRAQEDLLQAASRVFNDQTMQNVIEPLVTNLFAYGSGGLSIISFVVALWSGSKAVSAAVQAVVIVSGQSYEGYVRTRTRALVVYAAGLLGFIPALVMVLMGPALAEEVLDAGGRILYVVAMLLLVGALLSGLYEFAPRERPPWVSVLPGALAATTGWVLASAGLWLYVRISVAGGSLYAVVGTPIALLLWAYVSAYVVLLGALLNRLLRRPDLSSARPDERDDDH